MWPDMWVQSRSNDVRAPSPCATLTGHKHWQQTLQCHRWPSQCGDFALKKTITSEIKKDSWVELQLDRWSETTFKGSHKLLITWFGVTGSGNLPPPLNKYSTNTSPRVHPEGREVKALIWDPEGLALLSNFLNSFLIFSGWVSLSELSLST